LLLFVDRLPLHPLGPDAHSPDKRRWSVPLPILVTEPLLQLRKPRPHRVQRWRLDTALTDDAYAWRSHLLESGLGMNRGLAGPFRVRSAFGPPRKLHCRQARLWLVSNVPSLYPSPFPLDLLPGILVNDDPGPAPEHQDPLLGLRVLRRAGLCVQVNLSRMTVSVWVPGSLLTALSLSLRRLFDGYRTLPITWPDQAPPSRPSE
jgi:hypothetical protein